MFTEHVFVLIRLISPRSIIGRSRRAGRVCSVNRQVCRMVVGLCISVGLQIEMVVFPCCLGQTEGCFLTVKDLYEGMDLCVGVVQCII